MVNFFRKLLIRLGKIIPFLFSAIVCIGFIENIYALYAQYVVIDGNGEMFYDCPISTYITGIIYIDWFDVLIVWILCVALELCKYSFRCAIYITLNLAVRFALETLSLDGWVILPVCSFMALFGLFCVYGGFKMIKYQKGTF